jgi:hypothetical protein
LSSKSSLLNERKNPKITAPFASTTAHDSVAAVFAEAMSALVAANRAYFDLWALAIAASENT